MDVIVILSRCVYFLPVIFIHVHAIHPYNIYNIESDRTCSLSGFQARVLKLNSKTGVIVQENHYFDHGSFSGKYPFRCLFKVDAPANLGIFAVIQKMKLRKNETTGDCIDYVQFRHSNSLQITFVDISLQHKDELPWSQKMCGDVVAKEPNFSSINLVDPMKMLPYAFMDSQGKIDVKIFIANETRSPNTELDLKIAFTAYHSCSDVPLSAYRRCSSHTCIWGEFYKDEILNCPFSTCSDIGGCHLTYDDSSKPTTGLATKIMVGAVAGVFTMFVVFILFLWLFRHCAMCWNGPTPSAQSTTQMRPVPTAEEMQPTAPPRSPSIDKDLPPSYESLFPNA